MEIRDNSSTSRASALRRTEPSTAPSTTASGLGAGRPLDPVLLSGVPETELTPRIRQAMMALLAEIDQLRHDLSDARGRIDFLERLADEDPLIPVANRRAFLREVTRLIGFGQRYGTPASIIYIDVNHLKAINDSYGHAAGDAALLQVARTLLEQVRNTDVVARLGGDEFVILMPETDVESSQVVLRRVHQELLSIVQQRGFSVSFSIGVVTFFSAPASVDAMIGAADQLMYSAKRGDQHGPRFAVVGATIQPASPVEPRHP